MRSSLIVCEAYAGLHSQLFGLAEAAGLAPALHSFERRMPWRWLPTRLWPAPLAAAGLADPVIVGVLTEDGRISTGTPAALFELARW